MSHEHTHLSSRGEDPGLNMTPMIDVVFQLIVFFLLTLRFKSVDERIDSRMPRQGLTPQYVFVDDVPSLAVKLFRVDLDDDARAFTRIRVAGGATFELPRGDWSGLEDDDARRQAAYDAVRANVAGAIASAWQRMGRGPDVRGEIKTPAPTGMAVPHGDVMLVLDAFLEADLRNVAFEGTMPPVPRPGAGGLITR